MCAVSPCLLLLLLLLFSDLYSSQNTVRVTKLRRTIWAGHVEQVWGQGELYTGFWCGNLTEREHLEDPGVDWW